MRARKGLRDKIDIELILASLLIHMQCLPFHSEFQKVLPGNVRRQMWPCVGSIFKSRSSEVDMLRYKNYLLFICCALSRQRWVQNAMTSPDIYIMKYQGWRPNRSGSFHHLTSYELHRWWTAFDLCDVSGSYTKSWTPSETIFPDLQPQFTNESRRSWRRSIRISYDMRDEPSTDYWDGWS